MNLPIIDVNDKLSVKNACSEFGFFLVPIESSDIKLVNDAFNEIKKYFALTNDEKMKQIMDKNGLGYAPLKRVKIDKKTVEMKESYSFRPVNFDHCQQMDDDILNEYFKVMSKYGKNIFNKVIESLNLNPENYKPAIDPSYDTLTMIHYPLHPMTDGTDGLFGIAPHTDWGLITLLVTTDIGLQININGEWVDVPLLENHIIVNLGDMMEIISSGEYKSTVHRVITKNEKYSIAFFFEPNLDYVVKPYKENNNFVSIKYLDYIRSKLNYSYNVTFNNNKK